MNESERAARVEAKLALLIDLFLNEELAWRTFVKRFDEIYILDPKRPDLERPAEEFFDCMNDQITVTSDLTGADLTVSEFREWLRDAVKTAPIDGRVT